MILVPAIYPPIEITYQAALADGSALPSDFIEFDGERGLFTVESSDQDKDLVYNITVAAFSSDSRWTSQFVSAKVGLITQLKPDAKYTEQTEEESNE